MIVRNKLEYLSPGGLWSTTYCLQGTGTLGWPPGLTHRYYIWLEKLAIDKHSSLLQKFVNYGQKGFYNMGPGCQSNKTFYSGNL
jgi:hypothetical protein